MSAFRKASMWPPNVKVLCRMTKYSNPIEPLPPLVTDKNVLSLTPKSISDTLRARQVWNRRMEDVLAVLLVNTLNLWGRNTVTGCRTRAA